MTHEPSTPPSSNRIWSASAPLLREAIPRGGRVLWLADDAMAPRDAPDWATLPRRAFDLIVALAPTRDDPEPLTRLTALRNALRAGGFVWLVANASEGSEASLKRLAHEAGFQSAARVTAANRSSVYTLAR